MKEKGRKILNYIKFTKKELENYVIDSTSCIQKVNNTRHIRFPPYGMADFKNTLLDIINKKMIGFFDEQLNGIVLDVKNIKVLSTQWPIYNDSPELHIDINADFYVFKPKIGATVTGEVNHVTKTHIGVIIYRVFNASIRLTDGHQEDIKNTEIKFTVKKFDLQNSLPYIEGILITSGKDNKKKIDDSDNTDSGISTEINEDKKNINITKFSDEGDSDADTTLRTRDKKSVSFNLSENKFRSPSPFIKRERTSSESSSNSTDISSAFENSFSDLINELKMPKKAKNSKKGSSTSLDTTSKLSPAKIARKTESHAKTPKKKKHNDPISIDNLISSVCSAVKKEITCEIDTTNVKFKTPKKKKHVDELIASVCSAVKEEKLSDSDTPKTKNKHVKQRKSLNDSFSELLSHAKKEPPPNEKGQDVDNIKNKSKKRKAEESLTELCNSPSKKTKKKKRPSILDNLSSALFAECLGTN